MTARTGRPLRFLVGLLGLWIGLRALQLWPGDVALAAETRAVAARAEPAMAPRILAIIAAPFARPQEVAARPPAEPARVIVASPPAMSVAATSRALPDMPGAGAPVRLTPANEVRPRYVPSADMRVRAVETLAFSYDLPRQSSPAAGEWERPRLVPPSPGGHSTHAVPPPASQASVAAGAPLPAAQGPSRFGGSAWAILRPGDAAPFVPQLGGSQAGARLTYAIDAARRLSIAGRFSGALESRQSEAAIGLDWRPTSLPVHVVAEQRIGIDRARGGPALGLVGGFGPLPLTSWLMLDGYAQGGGIARDGIEGYVDGAMRISYPLARLGPARIDLGLGAWGAAQRGASRVDAGPWLSTALPVAGRSLRLSLEWRQRLAGRATPSSGPALTIGTDF
ncbi:hypothetical protein [Sphingomonas sp. Ag1]|jgi:hypothetical protein|uniref:hypothetical protein n=1 Tax=Sphingomonas sp. Ag1 TaxID=1642949 RepID=UPI0006227560|nr:hypothetical protein [Sphingomonas sp. Ag1]KKI19299.1 hypothetical protein XM50_09085 [Sphingomonas sp. Ag1]